MPKKKRLSFFIEVWKFILGALWYFLVTLIPAAIAIIEFSGGNKNTITNIPWWVWSIVALVLVAVAVLIAFRRYRSKPENEAKKQARGKSKSVHSRTKSGGQAISIGGDNFGPIFHGIENKQTRPDLTMLTEIRKRGYLLRNNGMHLKGEESLPLWIQNFESWNTEMLQTLAELDKDKARVLKVLGNIPRGTIYYPQVFNATHALKLDVFTEKLARLDKIIDDYLKIPVQADTTIKPSIQKASVHSAHSDFSNFSVQLDNITGGKNISGVGLGFLSEIKSAPPFLGVSHAKPIISKTHEQLLTEFFRATVYMERNRDAIRGGSYLITQGDNRKLIAKKVYGDERYEVYVDERIHYPNGTWLKLPYLNLNSPDNSYFIQKQISAAKDTEQITALLRLSYNLVEDEAIPLLRMIYDAAQKVLAERQKGR